LQSPYLDLLELPLFLMLLLRQLPLFAQMVNVSQFTQTPLHQTWLLLVFQLLLLILTLFLCAAYCSDTQFGAFTKIKGHSLIDHFYLD
jgi:hypothetical protein